MLTSSPPTEAAGDAQSRLGPAGPGTGHQRESGGGLPRAAAGDQAGPVSVKLGKIIRLPEGESYGAIEAPLGLAGAYIGPFGEKTPWRLKLRTPSFNNISCFGDLCCGRTLRRSVEATLASIGYVVGDIDK